MVNCKNKCFVYEDGRGCCHECAEENCSARCHFDNEHCELAEIE